MKFGLFILLIFLLSLLHPVLSKEEAKPAEESAPAEGGDQKPAEGDGTGGDSQAPPSEGGDQQPAADGDQKPAEGGDQTPAEGGDQKPAEGGDQKPAEGGDQKPAEGGDQKPAEGGDQKPAAPPADEAKPEEGADKPLQTVTENAVVPVGVAVEEFKTPGVLPDNLPDVKKAIRDAGPNRNDPEWAWLGRDEERKEEVTKSVTKTAAIVPPVGMHGKAIGGHSIKVYTDGTRDVGPVTSTLRADQNSDNDPAEDIPGIDGREESSNDPSEYAGAPPVGMHGSILTKQDKMSIRDFHEKLGHKLKHTREAWAKDWAGNGDKPSGKSEGGKKAEGEKKEGEKPEGGKPEGGKRKHEKGAKPENASPESGQPESGKPEGGDKPAGENSAPAGDAPASGAGDAPAPGGDAQSPSGSGASSGESPQTGDASAASSSSAGSAGAEGQAALETDSNSEQEDDNWQPLPIEHSWQ